MGLPGALAATFAVGSSIDTIGKFRNQGAVEDFRKDRFAANKKNAIESFLNSADAVRVQTLQERQQIATEIDNLTAQALSVRGAAAASAATAGVSGVSITDAQLDISRAESVTQGRLTQLQRFRETGAAFRIRDLELQAQNRIQSGIPGPFIKPNLFGELLGIGTSALSGFGFGKDFEKA